MQQLALHLAKAVVQVLLEQAVPEAIQMQPLRSHLSTASLPH